VDLAQMETFAEAMKRLGVSRLRVRNGEEEWELELGSATALPKGQVVEQAIQSILPTLVPDQTVVKSPLVGIFYSRPAPNRAPFLQPGQRILPETIIGIVEAMKVMNEIKAGVEGIFEDWGPADGDAVEYGTPLIRYSVDGRCKKS
jgi:biotin carboxyl carrier protein